jgi:3-dehydroquinate synthase
MLVCDEGLPIQYLEALQHQLKQADYTCLVEMVPQGEIAKDLSILQGLYSKAMQAGLNRRDVFLALGGGVVGDLTGFLAATYYRGTRFVQIPTTLLAQVDSSVGGKVAVNFADVKNSIGAFKQPELVVIDTDVLKTLPPREIQAGLAELFKYALIERTALDDAKRDVLWQQFKALGANWQEALPDLVRLACQIKSAVVARDETESFPAYDARGRVCLNLGHTFAHAYEAYYGYGNLLHGEAVSVGMLCALYANESHLGANLVQEVIATMEGLALLPYASLNALGELPSVEDLIPYMAKDKKVLNAGTLRLILPCLPLGTVVVQECDANIARKGIEKAHAYLKSKRLTLEETP